VPITFYFGALLNGETKRNFIGAVVDQRNTLISSTTHMYQYNAAGATLNIRAARCTTGSSHPRQRIRDGTPLGALTSRSSSRRATDIPAGTLLDGDTRSY